MRARADGALIVGAGPTGLTLALELARFDIPVRIIDRASEPARYSQALALQPRTLELLEPTGVTERLVPLAHRVTGVNIAHGTTPVAALGFAGTPSKYQGIFIVPQSRTETMMAQRLHALGISIERGVELVALEEHDDRVEVTLRGPHGEETVRAAYVAGCDGAHSTVRKLTGRAFEGHTVDESLVLADATLEANLPPSRAFVHVQDGAGVAAFFPMAPDRWRIVAIGVPATPFDRESLAALLQRHELDVTVTSVEWSAPFSVNQRRVRAYASPRVYLLGDAAHIHSPIGGQGMNSGIGDAVNLGWKLALTQHERLGPALLATYAAERGPVGRQLLVATDLGNRLMFSPPGWVALFRDLVAPLVTRNAAAARLIAETIAQLRVAYPHSPLSVSDGRQRRCIAGTRVTGARLAGYHPQPLLLPEDADGPPLTLVVRPDGYYGYVGLGLHPSGAAIYLREVIGVRDVLRAPSRS